MRPQLSMRRLISSVTPGMPLRAYWSSQALQLGVDDQVDIAGDEALR